MSSVRPPNTRYRERCATGYLSIPSQKICSEATEQVMLSADNVDYKHEAGRGSDETRPPLIVGLRNGVNTTHFNISDPALGNSMYPFKTYTDGRKSFYRNEESFEDHPLKVRTSGWDNADRGFDRHFLAVLATDKTGGVWLNDISEDPKRDRKEPVKLQPIYVTSPANLREQLPDYDTTDFAVGVISLGECKGSDGSIKKALETGIKRKAPDS